MNKLIRIAGLLLTVSGVLFLSVNFSSAQSETAKPESTQEKVAGGNARDDLAQLLEDAKERQVTYSGDKKLLAHIDQHTITVWSTEERRRLHKFVVKGRPLTVAFSPDGKSLVTADGEGNLEYLSTVYLSSLTTGKSRLIAKIVGVPTQFSFSPDGTRLAATSNLNLIGSIVKGGTTQDKLQTGGSIYVWQVSNGEELLKVDIGLPEYTAKLKQPKHDLDTDLDRKKATDASVAAYYESVLKCVPYRLEFSPDGQRLITVSMSGQETIYDSKTGKSVPTESSNK